MKEDNRFSASEMDSIERNEREYWALTYHLTKGLVPLILWGGLALAFFLFLVWIAGRVMQLFQSLVGLMG